MVWLKMLNQTEFLKFNLGDNMKVSNMLKKCLKMIANILQNSNFEVSINTNKVKGKFSRQPHNTSMINHVNETQEGDSTIEAIATETVNRIGFDIASINKDNEREGDHK